MYSCNSRDLKTVLALREKEIVLHYCLKLSRVWKGLDIWYLYSCLVCNGVLKVFRFRVSFVWNGLRRIRDWHFENYVSICFLCGCQCTFITHVLKVTHTIVQHGCSTVHSTGWLSWEIEASGSTYLVSVGVAVAMCMFV